MNGMFKAVFLVALLPVLLLQGPLSAAAQTDGEADRMLSVEYADGMLSVEARNVPLGQVLREIGGKAGFDTRQTSGIQTPFTGQFANMSLSEGLSHMLGKSASFVIKYGEGGKPQRLVILALPKGKVHTDTAAAGTGTVPEDAAGDPVSNDGREQIISQLGAVEPGARIAAIWQLRGMQPDKASAIAIDALRVEADARVRARFASLLGRTGGPQAVGALIDLLTDPSAHVQRAAALALAASGSEAADQALGLALLRRLGDEQLRMMIVDLLADRRSPIAQDYLKAVSLSLGGPVAKKARASVSGHLPIRSFGAKDTGEVETEDQPVRSRFLTMAAPLAK